MIYLKNIKNYQALFNFMVFEEENFYFFSAQNSKIILKNDDIEHHMQEYLNLKTFEGIVCH